MTVSRPDTSVSQSMGKYTQVTGQFPRFWLAVLRSHSILTLR